MRSLIVAVLLALSAPVRAQGTIYVSRPNCRVWQSHTDNPFDNTHYYRQPAIAWDMEYAVGSLATGMLLHQIGAPLWVAGALPTVAFGLVPHLLGFAEGRYQIDVAHWSQSLWNRATPAVWADDTRTAKKFAVWLAVETPLSCFDR